MNKTNKKYYINVAKLMKNNTPTLLPRPKLKIIFFPSGEDPT